MLSILEFRKIVSRTIGDKYAIQMNIVIDRQEKPKPGGRKFRKRQIRNTKM